MSRFNLPIIDFKYTIKDMIDINRKITVLDLYEVCLYAERAHGGQMYGDQPYRVHFTAVAQVLLDLGYDDYDLIVASILHDTVEDTDVTRERLIEDFNQRVADLVWAVTGIGHNRKTRNQTMYDKVSFTEGASLIKYADRIINSENSKNNNQSKYEMYKKENPTFMEKVGNPDQRLYDRLTRCFE